jgi:thiol-disulfide isomerase/thioredoxin
MIGLDSNVLVRYIVQDDPEQSSQASAFIKKTARLKSPVLSTLFYSSNWCGFCKALMAMKKLSFRMFYSNS